MPYFLSSETRGVLSYRERGEATVSGAEPLLSPAHFRNAATRKSAHCGTYRYPLRCGQAPGHLEYVLVKVKSGSHFFSVASTHHRIKMMRCASFYTTHTDGIYYGQVFQLKNYFAGG